MVRDVPRAQRIRASAGCVPPLRLLGRGRAFRRTSAGAVACRGSTCGWRRWWWWWGGRDSGAGSPQSRPTPSILDPPELAQSMLNKSSRGARWVSQASARKMLANFLDIGGAAGQKQRHFRKCWDVLQEGVFARRRPTLAAESPRVALCGRIRPDFGHHRPIGGVGRLGGERGPLRVRSRRPLGICSRGRGIAEGLPQV